MTPSPAFDGAPFTFEERMAEMAAQSASVFARYQVPGDVEVMEREVSGVPIRIYRPLRVAGELPLLIWMHGGAFIGGSMDMPEGQVTCFEIAHRAKALVVQIEYRLATDDIRMPELQKDALTAAEWVIANRERLGFDANRVFIGGASAGACLAGSLALMLRDRNIPMAGVIPIYGVGHRWRPEPTAQLMKHCTDHFGEKPRELVGHNEWLDPDTSKNREYYPWPADTDKLEKLPPYHFINADFDILRASGEPWAQLLRDHGVKVTEEVIEGSTHGYMNYIPSENAHQDQTLNRMSQIISEA